jgi:hypothetical protein
VSPTSEATLLATSEYTTALPALRRRASWRQSAKPEVARDCRIGVIVLVRIFQGIFFWEEIQET